MKSAIYRAFILLALAAQGCSTVPEPITQPGQDKAPAAGDASATGQEQSPPYRPAAGVYQSTGTPALDKMCLTMRVSDEANFCSGYILATFDRLALDRMICPPVTVTNLQLITIGRKYLQGKKRKRDRLASEYMREAFSKAFPCRK